MTFIPDIHTITALEVQETIVMGFRYQIQRENPEVFINQYFTNFNLLQFLKQIDQLLGPCTSKPINKVIGLYNQQQPEILIQYYSDNYNDASNGLALSRKFIKYKNELVVEHDYLILPFIKRGRGIGKKVLAYGLKQYLQMSVDKIKVHAALQDGGYVWARALFKASIKAEVDMIVQEAKTGWNQISLAW